MNKKYIPLIQLPIKQIGNIYQINASKNLENRLNALGIYQGVKIKKLNQGFGPSLIEIKQTKIALGRGITNKIIIEYQNEEE